MSISTSATLVRGATSVCAVAILAGALLRLAVTAPSGLWEDEIIAVTHAGLPPLQLVASTLRFDVHPPLYFLQLHIWRWFGSSDIWFKANSAFWGLVAIVSLWRVLDRRDGRRVAWAGAAVLAVLPAGLWMSQEVRPYAWLSVLLIWSYDLIRRVFSEGARGWAIWAVLFLLQASILFTHAIGLVAVAVGGLYAAALLIAARAERRAWWRWFALYAACAALALPIVISNALHDANLPAPTSARLVLAWLGSVVTAHESDDWTLWVGFCGFCAIVAMGVAAASTRLVTLSFLVLPAALAVAVSVGVTPVFKTNFFTTLAAPFMAIVVARLCSSLRPARRVPVLGGVLAAALVFSVWQRETRTISTEFRAAAADIAPQLQSGDVVYVPQTTMFWGMARYLVGPDWGSPLAVADLPNAKWRAVYDRLGPRLVAGLHLDPRTQRLPLREGASMLVGMSTVQQAEMARRVWLVTYKTIGVPEGLPGDTLGPLPLVQQRAYSELLVSLYERPPAASD